jgi:ElaB/YqjD/DUF883 family membrane-anchored ribosome-binding protein
VNPRAAGIGAPAYLELAMPTNATTPGANNSLAEADKAKASLKDAAEQARDRLTEAAHRTETAVRDGMETLKAQSHAYADNASQQLELAQRYVVEKVKERPVTAALTGLGVGVLIGLLLSGRSDRR